NYELEYINSVIEKDFGLINGQKCHEYFYDEDDICFECKIQEAFEGNIVEWEQHSYRTGKVFDALATPIIKLDGSMSVVVFLYDVTQRDKAKKALKESEEKFRELFNNAEDMITLGETLEDGTPGKFIEVNEAATRRLGYSREELLNMTPLDILQKDIEEAPKEAFKIAETGSATFETVHVAKNGSKIPVEVKIVILNLDGKDVLLGISRDVTERKNTEKALRESEEKFREIFNNANDMISLNEMIEGFPGKFIEINEVGIKRLGYSREELLNMGPADIVAPDKRPEMSANAAKLLKNSCNTFEITHITKNGDKIPVEVNNHLINYKGRKVCLAISRDITERKKADEELNKTINELGRSNAELQQFAYVASHDLQEPLRTIASFTQLLERRYKGKLDENADEFMDYIVEAAVRMKAQIEGLLEYSRIVTKGEEFEEVDMNKSLNNTLKILDTSIKEVDTEITYDKLPNVMGDALQLERVFQNLISNAIKFRKLEESLKIHISAYKSEDEKEYVFSVQDNGIGIEEQYLERIFSIFQRLHTRDVYKGTGIGLSIVKRIIERHHGRIWVESESGVGSTFYFTLSKPK
ncbi:MAG: PAS domain-containing sensor histidine kinase, partial [Methanobacterium sp.]